MRLFGKNGRLVVGVLWMSLALPLSADMIFMNSTNDLKWRFSPGTTEVADEILLSGSARALTNFSFEFWGTNTSGASVFSGTVEARVRFYLNDGGLFNGYSTPGFVLYDSGWWSVGAPSVRETFVFSAGSDGIPSYGLFLPASDMSWSVQFQGMGATDLVGVDLYSPPTVGQDYPDYWENTVTGWVLKTNAVPMDFGATFEATIPEPSVVTLSILGGLGILLCTYSRRLSRGASQNS